MYSSSWCSCSFEPEIIKIGQSSHKKYINNMLNFQESTTILNACTKNVWKLIEGTTYVAQPKALNFYNSLEGFIGNDEAIRFVFLTSLWVTYDHTTL